MFRRRAHDRPLFGFLVACLFCVFLVEQAPHLVHHVFEPDEVQPECPFATTGDRQPGTPATTAVTGAAVLSATPIPPLPAPRLVDAAGQPAAARAPPVAS